MKNRIRFAIVGLGHIGKRHAAMITEHTQTELVAIAETHKDRQQEVANQYNVPAYDGIEALLEQEKDIDVLCVCTPNGLHAEQALLGLENRCHIVCEKPMGLTKANCEAVIYKALQMSRNVFCVMQNRYSPPSVWLKEMLESGRLGKIFMVQINCYWNRDNRYYGKSDWKGILALDGGPLFTQFSHFIDIMYWLFGDINNVQARFNNFQHQHNTEFEDSGFVSFDFVNQGIGSLSYSTAIHDKNMESSMTIIAENGSIKVGGQYMDTIEYCHVKDYTMPVLPPSNPPNDYGTYKGSAANHSYIIQNVVDTLTGVSTITTNALEGLKVVEIIERIYTHRKL